MTALCECGCGQETPRASKTIAKRGIVKGEPLRFCHGHNGRKTTRYIEEDRGYDSPCWIWQLGKGYDGYPYMWQGGTTRRAHRVYYEAAKGPIPEGKQLDHLCNTPDCVNAEHLVPATARANVRRRSTTKLTERTAAQVKWLVREGWARADVAAAYGITVPTLASLAAGQSWKEVAPCPH